jgi:hypothetical protein
LLIDTTATAHLPGPQNPRECHLYIAEGCHLYIALTFVISILRLHSIFCRIMIMENRPCPSEVAMDFDHDAFLNSPIYAWTFRVMLGDIQGFLEFSEHNIEGQLLVERQSIRRRTLESLGFDDDHLALSYKNHLLDSAEHWFTVALPMQIRYAALGALVNTVGWAAWFFKNEWKPPLPKKLQNARISPLALFTHFDKTMALNKTTILRDYSHLSEVRNAVVHSGGVVRDYEKPRVLRKAVDALEGFSITNWHFWGVCIKIDRGALDPYIDSMAQLLVEIQKTADERKLLRCKSASEPAGLPSTSSG